MKVVLFCGGLGTRIREYSENIPKPMVPVVERKPPLSSEAMALPDALAVVAWTGAVTAAGSENSSIR